MIIVVIQRECGEGEAIPGASWKTLPSWSITRGPHRNGQKWGHLLMCPVYKRISPTVLLAHLFASQDYWTTWFYSFSTTLACLLSFGVTHVLQMGDWRAEHWSLLKMNLTQKLDNCATAWLCFVFTPLFSLIHLFLLEWPRFIFLLMMSKIFIYWNQLGKSQLTVTTHLRIHQNWGYFIWVPNYFKFGSKHVIITGLHRGFFIEEEKLRWICFSGILFWSWKYPFLWQTRQIYCYYYYY